MIPADNGVKRYVAFILVAVVVYQFAGMSRGIYYACVAAPGEDDYSLSCGTLTFGMSGA